jgi:hypothetical protein
MNVFLWETCQMSEEGQVAVATWVTYRYKVATGKFRMKANELRFNRLQSNAVPLRHAGSKGERIYSSHSFLTSTLDGVSCQCHFPAVLYPRGKDPLYPLDRSLGGPRSWCGHTGYRKKSFASAGDQTLVVHSVISHYTKVPQLRN